MALRTNQREAGIQVVRIAVQHPHLVWADGLVSLLRTRWDVEVVAAHGGAGWIDSAVAAGHVDVLLLHLDANDPELLDRIGHLRRVHPALEVVALSDSVDCRLAVRAMEIGVRGWVEPTASLDHLVSVLHGVVAGETWFPPALLTPAISVLLRTGETRETVNNVLSTLSAREKDVLGCLVEGMSRREIAERYVLSPHTIRTHINNLLRKLDVHSTLAAVYVARQAGLPPQRHSS